MGEPKFDALSWLEHVMAVLDVPAIQGKINAWLAANDYPDLTQRAAALTAWLTQTLAEADKELDPATMKATIEGIAKDLVSGAAGVDPKSWQGGG